MDFKQRERQSARPFPRTGICKTNMLVCLKLFMVIPQHANTLFFLATFHIWAKCMYNGGTLPLGNNKIQVNTRVMIAECYQDLASIYMLPQNNYSQESCLATPFRDILVQVQAIVSYMLQTHKISDLSLSE